TILVPELDVADEWSPEAEVTVGVEESSGKPMTYTLAVVDEGLLGLTRSEEEAREFFAMAVAKFWEKCVVGDKPLPDNNIEGYVYTMAKFLCLDHKRTNQKIIIENPEAVRLEQQSTLIDTQKPAIEYAEEQEREQLRAKALKLGIARLSDNCRKLFKAVLEDGIEKPAKLFAHLGLKNARAVTVLRYECTKSLKIKAAIELENLLQQNA
ncbi:MAG: hypothetical protein AAFO94_12930, partial [Bacteroidota bacterium]